MTDDSGSAAVALHNTHGGLDVADLDRLSNDNTTLTFRRRYQWLPPATRTSLGLFFEDRGLEPVVVEAGLHSWFANLLPEGALRTAIARSINVNPNTDHWELLLALGNDLAGAVRVHPRDIEAPRRPRPAPVVPTIERGLQVGLTGVQAKMSLRDVGDRRLVIPASSESGDIIAKLHDPRFPNIVRIEHATASWARSCGVVVPESSIRNTSEVTDLPTGFFDLGNGEMFISKRFDRDGERRVHMEDFAQILDPPSNDKYKGSYETIGAVVHEYCGEADFLRFIDQLVFCIVSGNGDAHLKNWSMMHKPGLQCELSPGYDLVSTVLCGLKSELALTFWDKEEMAAITIGDFELLAQRLSVDVALVRARVQSMMTAAIHHLDGALFTDEQKVRLSAHINTLGLTTPG